MYSKIKLKEVEYEALINGPKSLLIFTDEDGNQYDCQNKTYIASVGADIYPVADVYNTTDNWGKPFSFEHLEEAIKCGFIHGTYQDHLIADMVKRIEDGDEIKPQLSILKFFGYRYANSGEDKRRYPSSDKLLNQIRIIKEYISK